MELRDEIAALVGVSADKVALTASTTDGCNIALAGLDLREGDEVITTTDEHFGLARRPARRTCAAGR